jgi:hypothetical protein
MYRKMKKDDAEQKKLKRMDNRNTHRSGTGRSTGKGEEETKKEREDREKEEAIQKKVIRDQLAADPDLQFDNPFICTPMKKLAQLYDFEETLLTIDKSKKENRRGLQTICRMQGSLSQSYFLWDAQQHKLAREIYYELENRPEVVQVTHDGDLEETYAHMQFKQKNDVLRMQKELERDTINKEI